MQIQFKPGLRTLWRAAGTVQIGISDRRGTILDGLGADDSRMVEQLRSGLDPATLERMPPHRVARHRRMLRLLDDAGVLLVHRRAAPEAAPPGAGRLEPDAAFWSIVHPPAADGWPLLDRRSTKRVLIRGAGRAGTTLGATLAAAGVGDVSIADGRRVTPADLAPAGACPSDLGRRCEDVAADAVVRSGGRATTSGTPGNPEIGRMLAADPPDVAVLLDYGAADAAAADVLVAGDIPHLSVVIREDDVVVGPMVLPGSGPCLRCLDLHRGDRDPAWPSILAQLAARPAQEPTEESATAVLAAGLAALQVLAQLDGLATPATVGATLEIEPPDGLIARRTWPAHGSCGCHWPLAGTRPNAPSGSKGGRIDG